MATIIDKETIAPADISSDLVVLTYAELSSSLGGRPRLILPRIELGFNVATTGGNNFPIAGGGNYQFSAQIGGGNVTPVSIITVPIGQTSAVMQGRHLAVEPDDIITITVRGLPADTAVSVTTALFDATPIQQEDLDAILEQIDNITISNNVSVVAIQERILLGPCEQAEGSTPDQVPKSVIVPPTVIPQKSRFKT